MMRNLGGAVGIAACSAILNARTNFHFLVLASHLTAANQAMNNLMTGVAGRYTADFGDPQAAHLAALKQLWRLAYREAATLAYADAFASSCWRSSSPRCRKLASVAFSFLKADDVGLRFA